MSRRALAATVTLAVSGALASAADAHNDYVKVDGSTLIYQQYPGLAPGQPDNALSITYKTIDGDQYFQVDDPNSTGITNELPCVPHTFDDESVLCPAAGITSLLIDTGTGTDQVTITAPTAARIYGGPGNDTLRGGAGATQFFGQAGNDALVAGAGGGNVLDPGTGTNSLDAANGFADTVNRCTGLDTVTSDVADTLLGACPTTDVPSPLPPPDFPARPTPAPHDPAGGPTPSGVLLSSLRLIPASFRAAPRGASFAVRTGARLSFRLSAAADVTFRVDKLRRGRHRTFWTALGSNFKLRKRPAGITRTRFTGRVPGAVLRPGSYRLVAAPVDPDGSQGGTTKVRFRIVASPKKR
ncbi:MAG TPA: hypothetical protein VF752_03615 [Thermoleophilaceae bacterium]